MMNMIIMCCILHCVENNLDRYCKCFPFKFVNFMYVYMYVQYACVYTLHIYIHI